MKMIIWTVIAIGAALVIVQLGWFEITARFYQGLVLFVSSFFLTHVLAHTSDTGRTR